MLPSCLAIEEENAEIRPSLSGPEISKRPLYRTRPPGHWRSRIWVTAGSKNRSRNQSAAILALLCGLSSLYR